MALPLFTCAHERVSGEAAGPNAGALEVPSGADEAGLAGEVHVLPFPQRQRLGPHHHVHSLALGRGGAACWGTGEPGGGKQGEKTCQLSGNRGSPTDCFTA